MSTFDPSRSLPQAPIQVIASRPSSQGELQACGLCGCLELMSIFRLPVLDGPYAKLDVRPMRSFFRCGGCGYTFVDLPDPETCLRYYETLDSSYHQAHDRDTTRYNRIVQVLHSSEVKRVLDWGCGTGEFLSLLPTSVEKFGVEPCLPAAEKAKHKGIKILSQTQLQKEDLSHSFDAVTAIDLVEHIMDLQLLRRSLAELLRPGGLLVALTGNLDSLAARTLGRYWYYLHYSEHVSFLTEDAVSAWLGPDFEHVQILRVSHHRIPIRAYLRAGMVLPVSWLLAKTGLASRMRVSPKFPAENDHMLICARRRTMSS